jgi:hypothetical protein
MEGTGILPSLFDIHNNDVYALLCRVEMNLYFYEQTNQHCSTGYHC